MRYEFLVALFVPLGFFAAIVAAVKVVSDNRARRTAMERHDALDAETVEALFRRDPVLLSSLKWGLTIASVGAALMLLQFLPFGAGEPFSYGLVILFAGGGLLAYYGFTRSSADGGGRTGPGGV